MSGYSAVSLDIDWQHSRGCEAWQALEQSAAYSPFQRLIWNRAWWRTCGDALRSLVIAVSYGSTPICIMPLAVDEESPGHRHALFSGTGPSDYLDWLLAGSEHAPYAAACILSALDSEGIGELRLRDVRPESLLPLALRMVLGNGHGRLRIRAAETCYGIALPPTWTEYRVSRSANMREALRKAACRLREATLEPIDDLSAAVMGGFVDMHLAWRRSRAKSSVLEDVGLQAFFATAIPDLVARGFAEVTRLRYRGKTISYLIVLQHGRSHYFYQSAIDPDAATLSPGVAHMARVVGRAIDARMQTFDLLRGDEPYKRRWASWMSRTSIVELGIR